MPRITHPPAWGMPPGWGSQTGHEPELPFTGNNLDELANLLGREVHDIEPALKKAAESIWLFKYTEGPPQSEQQAALHEIFTAAEKLQTDLARIEPATKSRILGAYATPARAEVCSADTPAARYHAEDQYKADLATVDRLAAKITLAGRGRRGA